MNADERVAREAFPTDEEATSSFKKKRCLISQAEIIIMMYVMYVTLMKVIKRKHNMSK